MIVTTYTCDRCGKQQTKPTQMWTVGIPVIYADASGCSPSTNLRHSQLWCRNCCDKYDLVTESVRPPEAPPKPTLEDAIRELIRLELEGGQS